jgi:glycosyltransferase involved in cell wall biosynthesis
MIAAPSRAQTDSGRLKILYIQPGTATFAGIERVVDSISSSLAEDYSEDFDVDVLYVSVHSNRPAGREYTAIQHNVTGRIHLMWTIRRVVARKHYDLVVVPQIEATVICMTSCIGLRRRFALHLHGNPRFERTHVKAKILFFLMKVFFLRRVTSIFGTSPRQLDAFKVMFNSTRPQYWLPNPVRDFGPCHHEGNAVRDRVTFVNVGRFSYQKGQDILLAAFFELRQRRHNVALKIVGHGDGEDTLRAQISLLGLDDAVILEFHPNNPMPALVSSDVYVSSSRWEGWSLAICEALRFGLPVISSDCEFGPSDILIDERLGRLVPVDDIASLTEAMQYYCDHLSDELQHADFRRMFVDRFSEDRVVSVHAEALRNAATA